MWVVLIELRMVDEDLLNEWRGDGHNAPSLLPQNLQIEKL